MNFLSACGTSASARKQQPKRSEKEVKLDQTTSKSNETWILAPLQLGESITTRISPKGPEIHLRLLGFEKRDGITQLWAETLTWA